MSNSPSIRTYPFIHIEEPFAPIDVYDAPPSPPFAQLMSPFTPKSQFRKLLFAKNEYNGTNTSRNNKISRETLESPISDYEVDEETPKGCCICFRKRKYSV